MLDSNDKAFIKQEIEKQSGKDGCGTVIFVLIALMIFKACTT
jgi:hypothetical protein